MTDTFGRRLKRSRELKKVSIRDIAKRTKINGALFEGLERDDVSRWPGGIFRRAFIRSYAEAIGLDPDSTVREFVERFPDPSEPPVTEQQLTRDSSATSRSRARAGHGAARRNDSAPPPVEIGLRTTRARWLAAVLDLGSLLAITLAAMPMTNAFWMPFGVVSLVYFVGGLLVLGASPGAHFSARRADPSEDAQAASDWSVVGGSKHAYGDATRH
jgi:transcriptional regulator with XRE-family HTH domain